MTPSLIRHAVVTERILWIKEMMNNIRSLPLRSFEQFISDARNPAAAESYLRRALEAVHDLGRHILSKAFALTPSEYKDIANQLVKVGILTAEEGKLLRQLAGYRNRMVHFYNEITHRELYEICTLQLSDIELILDLIITWLKLHPEKLDHSI